MFRLFGRTLVDTGLIDEALLSRALEEQEKSGGRVGEILVSTGALSPTDLVGVLSQQLGLPTVDRERPRALLPAAAARRHQAVALEGAHSGGPPAMAMVDPTPEGISQIERIAGQRVAPHLADQATLDRLLTELYGEEEVKECCIAPVSDERDMSAQSTHLSRPQIAVVLACSLLGVLGLLLSPYSLVIAVTGLSTATFLAYSVFRLACTWSGWKAGEVAFRPPASELEALDERDLPVYSLLLPVFKEKEQTLRVLIASLEALDYPKHKLEGMLLVEADDDATRSAVESIGLPGWLRILSVPSGGPRTKPKAIAWAFQRARGEMVTIYDAEDIPEPQQLKEVIWALRTADDPSLACLQARLNYYNPSQNLLTRWFTLEYSAWFDLFLPGLYGLGAPIPLGGTSNHIRADALHEAGDWDPYNVTEDADLGVRLARLGYRTAMLGSTTYEEANGRLANWIRQRSRWIKGYMQTLLVHTRHPWALRREIGLKATVSFIATLGGLVFTALAFPWFAGLTLLWVLAQPEFIPAIFPGAVYYGALASLLLGNFLFVYLGLAGAVERSNDNLALAALLMPLYWLLQSVAGYIALVELVVRPHHWHKTEHGLDGLAESPSGEN